MRQLVAQANSLPEEPLLFLPRPGGEVGAELAAPKLVGKNVTCPREREAPCRALEIDLADDVRVLRGVPPPRGRVAPQALSVRARPRARRRGGPPTSSA